MQAISLDASGWTKIDDFCAALLPALGAPAWHSRDINALIDSIIGGSINAVEPPFVIRISNTSHLDPTIAEHLALAKFHLGASRDETRKTWGGRDVDAEIEIVS